MMNFFFIMLEYVLSLTLVVIPAIGAWRGVWWYTPSSLSKLDFCFTVLLLLKSPQASREASVRSGEATVYHNLFRE